MNTNLSIIAFHSAEECVFECIACGRNVKRLAVLSDGRGMGLDCAAAAMGRPRTRRALADLEVEARVSAASAKGAAWVSANPRPAGLSRRDWLAPMLALCPYATNSVEYHAFVGAA